MTNFILEMNQIICGDAVEALKNLPANTFHLTITSPPVDIIGAVKDILDDIIHNEQEASKLDEIRFDNNETKNKDEYLFDIRGAIRELYRVTKPGGVVIWVTGQASNQYDSSLRPYRHIFQFRKAGFNLHDTMVYLLPRHKPRDKTKQYEEGFCYMLVFTKGRPTTFTPQERRKTNVWEMIDPFVETQPYLGFTGFNPEDLYKDQILTWTEEGDVVLDPFCGLGTTLRIAKQLNRKFIGIDVVPQCCDAAYEKIKAMEKKEEE